MNEIWYQEVSLELLNNFNKNTLMEHLDIVFTNLGPDFIEATMPVDHRTFQPFKLLHGGASCVLAETIGSIAANLCLDPKKNVAVGQHIEATHLRSESSGRVRGVGTPIYIGKSSHTWNIKIYNMQDKLVCDSKIIMFIKNL